MRTLELHSCDMFVRVKPIRLGYKLRCLGSPTQYLFNCIKCSGSAYNYSKEVGLTTDATQRLLGNIEFADMLYVY